MNLLTVIFWVVGSFAITLYVVTAALACNHLLTKIAEWIHKHYE